MKRPKTMANEENRNHSHSKNGVHLAKNLNSAKKSLEKQLRSIFDVAQIINPVKQ